MNRQVVRERSRGKAQGAAEDALLEQEMDALSHPLAQPSMRQSAGLPPISHRAAQGACSSSAGSMLRWDCALHGHHHCTHAGLLLPVRLRMHGSSQLHACVPLAAKI